jgi:hypothetical protein
MVEIVSEYPFSSVIDDFFAVKKFNSRHGEMLRSFVRMRAGEILTHPDARYMPAFKILDLLAGLVNQALSIAIEPQFNAAEAKVMVREALADSTPLIRQFMLDAALERARYQPMMLSNAAADDDALRTSILHQRWAAMRAAHQEKAKLPEAWIDAIDHAVEAVIAAPEFQRYRHGPLLQYFSEMLAAARTLYHPNAPIESLTHALRVGGTLWKRYALKSKRYEEHLAPSALMRLNTPLPGLPTIH